MDNKLRKKALNILVKFPSISSYELANILCIDERQARKLIKNLPQDIIEENVRKIKKEKKEEKQEARLDKKSQIGATLRGTISIHKDGSWVLSSGNISVDLLLQHKFALSTVAIIFLTKFFITPLCFGSGAAGGIFLPMLMLGSFLGYGIGAVFCKLGVDVNPIVIAMIGMGAFLSAVARTPITAVVMVFEMTGGYHHILPIMLSAAIADLVAEKMNHRPIYASLIVNQAQSEEAKLLSRLYVKDVMARNVVTLNTDSTIKQAENALSEYGHGAYPIINSKNKLAGIITKSDIEDALFQGIPESTTIDKIMNPAPVTITPQNNLYIAYYRLHSNDTEWLVVIDRNNKIKGIITRLDINNAFHKEFA